MPCSPTSGRWHFMISSNETHFHGSHFRVGDEAISSLKAYNGNERRGPEGSVAEEQHLTLKLHLRLFT